jgi:hypothetical protein
MTMRNECMAPNGRQRALMLQMNAVDRRIDQKVRLLLRLEKFGRTGTLPPSRILGANGTAGESDEHKKRYGTVFS